jgi:hypothetical protein
MRRSWNTVQYGDRGAAVSVNSVPSARSVR